MANNRFLAEDFKAACTAAKPRFEWPTMSQLKQKFLAHHRDNQDQLKSCSLNLKQPRLCEEACAQDPQTGCCKSIGVAERR